jgi:hypothetical protein
MLLIALMAVAGCSQNQLRRWDVAGSFTASGGPAPGIIEPLPGRVVASNQAGQVFSVTVGRSGHFRMFLPTGAYRFTGYGPGGCVARGDATVRGVKQTTRVQVVCAMS